ncbi:MAG: VWA domain-containing protein [Gemmatimonadota bacterium]|nr:VWA domain-containing protein [Gemmatimonadota bacterium]
MFRFGSPGALFALLLVPLLAVFLRIALHARRRALERFADLDLVERLTRTVDHRRRAWKTVLLVVGVALSLVALARPQFGTRLETVRREGMDIVVALDLSESMLAEDIAPNRLERSKLEIQRLISRLDGDRIGLVAFAGRAFVQSPLTSDYGAARLFLNAMDTDLVPVQGTDVGAALEQALDSFRDESLEHRVVVLVTDGEDHEGRVDEMVARAADSGVRVYTVGIGSAEGVPIPEFDERGQQRGFKRDEEGAVVTTRLEEGTLRRIASMTGGRLFRSTPQASELTALVDELEALGGREIDAREITQFEERFQLFLGVAMLLLFLEGLISDRRREATTWKGRFS